MTIAFCGLAPARYFAQINAKQAAERAAARAEIAEVLADLPSFDVILALENLPPPRTYKSRRWDGVGQNYRPDRKRQKRGHRA